MQPEQLLLSPPIPDQSTQPDATRITALAGGLTDALGGLRGISVTAENADESLARLEEIRRALALIVRGEERIPQATTLSQSPHEVVEVAVAASGDLGETQAEIVQVAVAKLDDSDDSAPNPQPEPHARPPQSGVRHRIESVWENVNPGIKTAVRMGASALGQRVGSISTAALRRSNPHVDRRSSPPEVVQPSVASVDAQAHQGGQIAPDNVPVPVVPPSPQPEPLPPVRTQSMSAAEYSSFQGSLSQALERFHTDGEPVPSHLLDVGIQALNDGRVNADEMISFVMTYAEQYPERLEEVLNNDHMDPEQAAWGLRNQLLWHCSPDLARQLNEIHDAHPDKSPWYDQLLENFEEPMDKLDTAHYLPQDKAEERRTEIAITYFLLTGETMEHAQLLSRKMDVSKQKGKPVPIDEVENVKDQYHDQMANSVIRPGDYLIMSEELLDEYLWMVQNGVSVSVDDQAGLLFATIYHRRGVREALDAQTNPEATSVWIARLIEENPYRLTPEHFDQILTDYEEVPPWLTALQDELDGPRAFRDGQKLVPIQEKINQRIDHFPYQIEQHKKRNATMDRLVHAIELDKAYKKLRKQNPTVLQPLLDGEFAGSKQERFMKLIAVAISQSVDVPINLRSSYNHIDLGDFEKSTEAVQFHPPREVWEAVHEYFEEEVFIINQRCDADFAGATINDVVFVRGELSNVAARRVATYEGGGDKRLNNVKTSELDVDGGSTISLNNVHVQEPINPMDSNFVFGDNTTLAFDLHHAGAGNIYAGGGDRISCGIRDIGKESLVLVMDPGEQPLITNDTRNTFPPHKNRGSHILHIPLSNENVQSQADAAQTVNLAELTYGDETSNDFQNEAPVRFSHNGNEYVLFHAHDIEVSPSTKEMREGKETNIVNTKVKAPLKAILQKVENEGKAEYVFVGVWDGGDTMKIDSVNVPVGNQKATPIGQSLLNRLLRKGK